MALNWGAATRQRVWLLSRWMVPVNGERTTEGTSFRSQFICSAEGAIRLGRHWSLKSIFRAEQDRYLPPLFQGSLPDFWFLILFIFVFQFRFLFFCSLWLLPDGPHWFKICFHLPAADDIVLINYSWGSFLLFFFWGMKWHFLLAKLPLEGGEVAIPSIPSLNLRR